MCEPDHPGPDLDHLGLDRRSQRLGRHTRHLEQLGRMLDPIADKLLANPVIEDFVVHMPEPAEVDK